MTAAVEQIITALAQHATGGMEDLVRELLHWVEDTGNVEDLDWALVRKEDIEGVSEALYGVALRFEELVQVKASP